MPRTIESHKVNGCNESLLIEVLDEPGAGGASHHYRVSVTGNPNFTSETDVYFQNGPIAEAGVNGLTQEALIAICVDRLQSFQKGPYACRENALALTHLEDAQHWLQHRTRARLSRGVEGTHEK